MDNSSSGRYVSDRERMKDEFFKDPPPPLKLDPPLYDYIGQVRRVWGVKKNYGCLAFVFDCVMVAFTGGFWFIWIFVREMRRAFPRD